MSVFVQVNPTSLPHLSLHSSSLRHSLQHMLYFSTTVVIPGCLLMKVYGLNRTAPHLGLHALCSIPHGSERNVINVQPLIKEGVYTLGGEE